MYSYRRSGIELLLIQIPPLLMVQIRPLLMAQIRPLLIDGSDSSSVLI